MLQKSSTKLLAFDLDGTLTQHKTPLSDQYKKLLHCLSQHYLLLMVGAGSCNRIYQQMNNFPIPIIGNYGMQYSVISSETGKFILKKNIFSPVDCDLITTRTNRLREELSLTNFQGNTIEIHPSGMLTFPILGTEAPISEKLSYDPTRRKRREFFQKVAASYPEYKVYIGGTSSFDIVPRPYSKLYALDLYCQENHLSHSDILYFGDDYGMGGNDEDVYLSDIPFQKIDNFKDFGHYANELLP